MKKNQLLLTLLSLSFLLWMSACEKNNASDTPLSKADKKWTNKEIDAFIEKTIKERDAVFDWAWASDDMLWSAVVNSDNMIAVGYKPARATDKDAEQYNAEKDADWRIAKNQVATLIAESEQKATPSVDYSKMTVGNDFDNLNAFYVKVSSFETIQKLRQSPMVRYVYPSGYSYEDHQVVSNRSDSGCDGYVGEPLVSGTDFVTVSPNAKQSWTYPYAQIPQAWARTTGASIKIAVIDAGVSSAQAMFSPSNWASGGTLSTRTIELISRYPSQVNFWGTQILAYDPSPYSSCGHGTTMMGIVGSPRNNLGASLGVAYNSNVISIRAVEDVIISNSKEELGVAAALNEVRSRSDVKIVSMSIGSITTRSVIGDAIKAVRNAGKLPFCAAGTSLTWTTWFGVVYPASMSEAVAVTGVTETGSLCDVCHSGSQVDYVAVMDRNSDGKSVLSLATSGFQPATVGGSSAATATTAGIAALIWARNPAMTSAQVLNRLTVSGSYYPSVNSRLGWGIVNANTATNF